MGQDLPEWEKHVCMVVAREEPVEYRGEKLLQTSVIIWEEQRGILRFEVGRGFERMH
jgi:hypothetical protein